MNIFQDIFNSNRNFNKIYYLYLISALLFLISRAFHIFHDFPPYQFCDEYLTEGLTWERGSRGKLILNVFKAPGFNYLPMIPFAMIVKNHEALLIIGRFFYLFLLGFFTSVYIFKTTYLLSNNKNISYLSCILFFLSPYVYSVGRFWYPDHYIYFFSSSSLYYLLKIYFLDQKEIVERNNFRLLGFFSGCLLSVKYTSLALIPVLFFFLFISLFFKFSNQVRKKALFFLELLAIFILTFFLFNYSIFFKLENFINDFIWNINNYSRFEKNNYEFFYYLSIFIFMFSTSISYLFIAVNFFRPFKSKVFIFIIFIFTPIIFIFFISFDSGLVLHRNLSILIPFHFPLLAFGIYHLYNVFADKGFHLGFIFKILFAIYFLYIFYVFFISFNKSIKVDSRVEAQSWIKNNINLSSTVGTNESCSGESPASQIVKDLHRDPFFKNNYDYYIINSYWDSAVDYLFREKQLPPFYNIYQSNIHFYHFNIGNIFTKNPTTNSNDSDIRILERYTLVKTISGYGPEIFIFKNKHIDKEH